MDNTRGGQRHSDYRRSSIPQYSILATEILDAMKNLPSWIHRRAHMSRRSICVAILPVFALLGLCLRQLSHTQTMHAYSPYRPFHHAHRQEVDSKQEPVQVQVEDHRWEALNNRSPTNSFRGASVSTDVLRPRPSLTSRKITSGMTRFT